MTQDFFSKIDEMDGAKLAEVFKVGKIPKKNLLCMTNEHKLKLLELQGPLNCKAGIMCLNRGELFAKDVARVRDMFTKALIKQKFFIREELKNSLLRNVTLPEHNLELVERYLRNVEFMKSQTHSDEDKLKMCPMAPLLMFPPSDVSVRT